LLLFIFIVLLFTLLNILDPYVLRNIFNDD
jgi:hypothetical protein